MHGIIKPLKFILKQEKAPCLTTLQNCREVDTGDAEKEFGESMIIEISGDAIQMGAWPKVQEMVRSTGKPVVCLHFC